MSALIARYVGIGAIIAALVASVERPAVKLIADASSEIARLTADLNRLTGGPQWKQ